MTEVWLIITVLTVAGNQVTNQVQTLEFPTMMACEQARTFIDQATQTQHAQLHDHLQPKQYGPPGSPIVTAPPIMFSKLSKCVSAKN